VPVYTFNGTNPCTVGNATKKDHFDRGFNNTLALKQGDQALDQFVGAVQDVTAIGTQNNFAVSDAAALLRCNPGAALTLTGLLPSVSRGGRLLYLQNISANTITISNEGGSSTAANRIVTESVAGQVLGPRGSGLFWYDVTSLRWRFMLINPGGAIAWTPTSSATGGATFTPTSTAARYRQWGNEVRFALVLTGNITVAAAPAIGQSLPVGQSDGSQLITGIGSVAGAGTFEALQADVPVGTSTLLVYRLNSATTWNIAAGHTVRLDGSVFIS
jgi:hypothetical protein